MFDRFTFTEDGQYFRVTVVKIGRLRIASYSNRLGFSVWAAKRSVGIRARYYLLAFACILAGACGPAPTAPLPVGPIPRHYECTTFVQSVNLEDGAVTMVPYSWVSASPCPIN
jgi:hypothetical protein